MATRKKTSGVDKAPIKPRVKKVKTTGIVKLHFILDETGSMNPIRDKTISGFNEYIESLRTSIPETRVSLSKFSSYIGVQPMFVDVPVTEVKPLTPETYRPNGMTPLYDAVAKTINEAKQADSPDAKILVAIQTDGEENSSREYNFDAVKSLIDEAQKKPNWTIIMLGAGLDAWKGFGAAMGLHKGNVKSYDKADTLGMFSALGGQTTSYGASASKSTRGFFSGSDD